MVKPRISIAKMKDIMYCFHFIYNTIVINIWVISTLTPYLYQSEALQGKSQYYTRKGIILSSIAFLYPIRYTMSATHELIDFVKTRREQLGLTQQDLSDRAGVGLRFIRDLEQGKESLRLDKVNQVLALFGHKMGPIKIKNRDEL